MNKLAEKQEVMRMHEAAQAPAEASSILQVIERVAMNPSVDPDKMERLLAMQERVMDRQAKAAFTQALAEMQEDLPVIERRGAIKIREVVQSKYALWEDIHEQIKGVLAKHGFSLNFRVGNTGDKISVTAILSHREGHSEESGEFVLPADTSGNKNSVQALGSSIQYGKRYTATALLNISTVGEDDDAQAATEKIKPEQVKELSDLCDNLGVDKREFCEWGQIAGLADITVKNFATAKQAIMARGKAKAKANA